MDDIIASYPVEDRGRWDIRHVWAYSDGTYTVCDADGNHDAINASDIPPQADVAAAWRDYAAHVARHGDDPLREYMVRRTVKRREHWRAQIVNSILGVCVRQLRRRGRTIQPGDAPAHVRDYLTLGTGPRRMVIESLPSWRDVEAAGVKLSREGWHRFVVEYEAPRSAAVVARELRRIARARAA